MIKTSLFLFLIALTIRLGAIFWWQFDGLYGQDAYAYFDQAVAITQTLPHGQPPPTDFFWPNGYPVLVAFFMGFFGQTAWAGQLVALLCGAALAPLAYWLCQEMTADGRPSTADKEINPISHHAGLLAGLIIAVAGQPILSSIVIMADTPALFWAGLATWLVVRAVKFRQGGKGAGERGGNFSSAPPLPCSPALWSFAAGVALAFAIVSRWLYVLIVPALGAYILFTLSENSWRAKFASAKASFGFRFINLDKIPWGALLFATLGGAMILVPQLWLSLNKPEGLAHSWLLGWNPANFFRREFENIDGHFVYPLPNAIFYAQPAGHPAYIFPLLGIAALWGSWRLWQSRHWGPLILLLGWIIPVYLFLAGIPYQNFRFGLTLYLPLVILTGFGLSDLGHVIDNQSVFRRSAVGGRRSIFLGVVTNLRHATDDKNVFRRSAVGGRRSIFLGAMALSLAGMLAWAYPMLDNFLTIQNQSKQIAREVEQVLPPESTLITFGLTLTMQHYTQLHPVELFYLDEDALKTVQESPGPLYLLLDVDSIESQWKNKVPQQNYQWLKDHTTLTQINTFPPYHLFKVTSNR